MQLSNLKPAKCWREQEATGIFPTKSSWEWFRRKHSIALIESGEMIPQRGRRGDLVGPNIGEVVVQILRDEAQAAVTLERKERRLHEGPAARREPEGCEARSLLPSTELAQSGWAGGANPSGATGGVCHWSVRRALATDSK